MIKRRRTLGIQEGDSLIPIMNLVCMLIPMLLYGAVFVKLVTVDVKQTSSDISPPPKGDPLNLTVMITDSGFYLKVNPTHRLPWMEAATGQAVAAPDIPKNDDGWDFKALATRLREIKDNHRQETNIIIGAEDNIALEVLIKTMDYARGTTMEALFPDVTLMRGVV